MNSIRTKTTLLTVCAIIVAMTIATLLGAFAIRNIGINDSDQMLLLLCETGEKDLDYYFESVEQSVDMVSVFVEADLKDLPPEEFTAHLDRVRDMFSKMAYKTNGVLTYYYRIDPAVSQTDKGFWYVRKNEEGFQEHKVTDITLYDTEDPTALVWFTVPKTTGKSVWLPPYITDNLNVRVISYNVPIYQGDLFIGVIGIEIDYSTMAEEVDNITLYENGYAFINDSQGNLVYHPRIDVTTMEQPPLIPSGVLSEKTYIQYSFEGVEKQAVWLPLSNGMRLNVTVPISEINSGWHQWINQIVVVSVVLLLVFIVVTMRFTGHITKPLRELTKVAEQMNAGNYDYMLESDSNDEVGILTRAFSRLIAHLKTYISDLNALAYADALTSVRNKGAFDIYVQELQAKLEDPEEHTEFAVCILDCNNLKAVNDQSGHDKGDLYLKASCALICDVFDHSPVFRIGGDEFAVVLMNTDFENRNQLLERFDKACNEKISQSDVLWEQIDIARGLAIYDPHIDKTVNDVIRRADKQMYINKGSRKRHRRR